MLGTTPDIQANGPRHGSLVALVHCGTTRRVVIESDPPMHHLTKGDIVAIPAKTPHQWKDTSKTGSVCYYAVNYQT